MIVTFPRFVDERDGQVITDALNMAVSPKLIRRHVNAARRMGINLIRRAVNNVHVAAIGLPARPAGCRPKMLVGIGDPAEMFRFKLIFNRSRCWIAPLPELLGEFIPFFIGSQS